MGPGIGLGVRRLAIVDLETGDQPIANEDGSVVVVCNGEIYNHVELRAELTRSGHRFRTRSDVETIAHLYEDLGPDCVRRRWDVRVRALGRAARAASAGAGPAGDQAASLGADAEGIAFGSEFKALLAGGQVAPALDAGAVDELFAWGWVLTPRSSCAGVSRLPAGHVRCGERVLGVAARTRCRCWRAGSARGSEQEWAEGLLARLEDAVRIHLRADVPVGVWLSGGSTRARWPRWRPGSWAERWTRSASSSRIRNMTRSAPPARSTNSRDTRPGAPIRFAENDPRALLRGVWHGEELGRGSGNLRQRISELTASRVKVALAGEGSDEMLCGYWWYKRDRRMRWVSRLSRARDRWWRTGPSVSSDERTRRLARVSSGPGPERSARWPAHPGPRTAADSTRWIWRVRSTRTRRLSHRYRRSSKPDPVEWLQYWDVTTRMHDHIVQTLDRHSMAWSIEVRVPFLDHEVAEWCLAIPPRLKRARPEKRVPRRALARDPPARDLGASQARARGPPAGWLGPRPLRFVADLLSPEGLRAKGWFDPERGAAVGRPPRGSSRCAPGVTGRAAGPDLGRDIRPRPPWRTSTRRRSDDLRGRDLAVPRADSEPLTRCGICGIATWEPDDRWTRR